MKEYKVFYLANVDEHPAKPDEGYVKLYCYGGDWYTKNSDNEIRLLSNVRVLDSDGNPFSNSDIQFEGAFNITEEGGVTIISLDYDGEDGIPEHGNEAHNPDFATLQQLIDHMEDDDDPHGYVSLWEEDGGLLKTKGGEGVNIANQFIVPTEGVGEISMSRDLRITSAKDLHIDKLATGGDPKPALIDSAGKVVTSVEITGDNTITINVYDAVSGAPISGYIQFFNLAGYEGPIQFSGTPSVVIENLPNIATTVSYRIDDTGGLYRTYFGYFSSIPNSVFQEVFMQSLIGGTEGDAVAGVKGELIDEGSESNFELAKPTSVVQVASNYDKVLSDPEDTKTAEFTARKGADGGALTLQCNVQFMMDGVLGDVLTTTTQGAWIRVKSIEVDGTWRYVVIMDSGDWILD